MRQLAVPIFCAWCLSLSVAATSLNNVTVLWTAESDGTLSILVNQANLTDRNVAWGVTETQACRFDVNAYRSFYQLAPAMNATADYITNINNRTPCGRTSPTCRFSERTYFDLNKNTYPDLAAIGPRNTAAIRNYFISKLMRRSDTVCGAITTRPPGYLANVGQIKSLYVELQPGLHVMSFHISRRRVASTGSFVASVFVNGAPYAFTGDKFFRAATFSPADTTNLKSYPISEIETCLDTVENGWGANVLSRLQIGGQNTRGIWPGGCSGTGGVLFNNVWFALAIDARMEKEKALEAWSSRTNAPPPTVTKKTALEEFSESSAGIVTWSVAGVFGLFLVSTGGYYTRKWYARRSFQEFEFKNQFSSGNGLISPMSMSMPANPFQTAGMVNPYATAQAFINPYATAQAFGNPILTSRGPFMTAGGQAGQPILYANPVYSSSLNQMSPVMYESDTGP